MHSRTKEVQEAVDASRCFYYLCLVWYIATYFLSKTKIGDPGGWWFFSGVVIVEATAIYFF